MKKLIICFSLVTSLCLGAANLSAADAKTYQVTGPVLELTDSYVVIQKGNDKWQINIDGATKAKLKVGDKVTITYRMVATDVDVKPAKAGKEKEKK